MSGKVCVCVCVYVIFRAVFHVAARVAWCGKDYREDHLPSRRGREHAAAPWPFTLCYHHHHHSLRRRRQEDPAKWCRRRRWACNSR